MISFFVSYDTHANKECQDYFELVSHRGHRVHRVENNKKLCESFEFLEVRVSLLILYEFRSFFFSTFSAHSNER